MPIHYRDRILFMFVCLLFIVVLPGCTATEGDGDIEPSIVEITNSDAVFQIQLDTLQEIEVVEVDLAQRNANKPNQVESCGYTLEEVVPTEAEFDSLIFGEPNVILTTNELGHQPNLIEWNLDNERILVTLKNSIFSLNVADGTIKVHVDNSNRLKIDDTTWLGEDRIAYIEPVEGEQRTSLAYLTVVGLDGQQQQRAITSLDGFAIESIGDYLVIPALTQWNQPSAQIISSSDIINNPAYSLLPENRTLSGFSMSSQQLIDLDMSPNGRWMFIKNNSRESSGDYLLNMRMNTLCRIDFGRFGDVETLNDLTQTSWNEDGSQLMALIGDQSANNPDFSPQPSPDYYGLAFIDPESKIIRMISFGNPGEFMPVIDASAMSPDGKYVVAVLQYYDSQPSVNFVLIDLQTMKWHVLKRYGGGHSLDDLTWSGANDSNKSYIAYRCLEKNVCMITVNDGE